MALEEEKDVWLQTNKQPTMQLLVPVSFKHGGEITRTPEGKMKLSSTRMCTTNARAEKQEGEPCGWGPDTLIRDTDDLGGVLVRMLMDF